MGSLVFNVFYTWGMGTEASPDVCVSDSTFPVIFIPYAALFPFLRCGQFCLDGDFFILFLIASQFHSLFSIELNSIISKILKIFIQISNKVYFISIDRRN